MNDVLSDREKDVFNNLKKQFNFAVEIHKTSCAGLRLERQGSHIYFDRWENFSDVLTEQDAEQVARHKIRLLIRDGLTITRREGVARKICAALEKESVEFQRLFLQWIDYETWRHAPNIYPDPRGQK